MMVLGQEIYIYLLTGILALGATAVAVVPFLISSRRSRVRGPGKPTEAAVEPEAARPSILRRIGDGIERLLARLWELRSVLRRPVDAAAAATAEAEAERPPFWRRKRDSLRRIRALRLRMPVELAGAAEAPVGHIAAPPSSVSPEPPVLNSPPEPPPAMADVSSATASETVAAVPDLLPVVEPPPVTADEPPVMADAPPVMADAPPVTADAPPVTADAPPVTADAPPVMADVPSATASEPVAAVPDLPVAEPPPVMADPPSAAADAPPSAPAPETVVAEGVVSEPMAADVLPIEEQLPPQPPAEPDLPPAQRLSVGELAKREQNVDKLLDEESENAEENEERYLEEAVSEDVKEVFGTGVGDEDEGEEKDELDSMFDLFKTEIVVETDASRLAALLGEVDARDLLSEAQEILNELRSPARRGGR